MKLLTLNVHAWLEDNSEEKMDRLARVIAEKSYDVIALQEVNQTMNEAVIFDDVKADNYGWLLQQKINRQSNIPYQYIWSNSHIGYSKYDEGLAILTKLPIHSKDAFYCSQSQTLDSIQSRKIVSVTIEYKGELIDCYSCHINLPDAPGENQLDNIQRILDRHKNSHLKILMGDFNVDAFSNPHAYESIKQIGLWDTYELAEQKDNGITVPSNIDGWQHDLSGKRLDYIFINQKRSVQSSRIIFNGTNYPVVSDHYGLEVNLLQ